MKTCAVQLDYKITTAKFSVPQVRSKILQRLHLKIYQTTSMKHYSPVGSYSPFQDCHSVPRSGGKFNPLYSAHIMNRGAFMGSILRRKSQLSCFEIIWQIGTLTWEKLRCSMLEIKQRNNEAISVLEKSPVSDVIARQDWTVINETPSPPPLR